jgi:Xaa-Pro aminopeptidase
MPLLFLFFLFGMLHSPFKIYIFKKKLSMFSAKTYATRRQKLMKSVGNGLILLPSNEEVGMNYRDNTFRWRQDSNFLYFAGIDQPSLAILMDADAGQAWLVGEEITIDHIIWVGPQPTLSSLAEKVGFAGVLSFEKMVEKIRSAQNSKRIVHFTPPYREDRTLKLADWLKINPKLVEKKASLTLQKSIISLRQHKSSEEIEQMTKAVNITRSMHLAAMHTARPGMKEYVVVGKIMEKMHEFGAELAYPVIFSINGQTLHNHFHGNEMLDGQLALGDFGAENGMHYAGDITRTFPVGAKFTGQQKAIYELVLKMETTIIKALKPGVQYRKMHLKANQIMLDGLKSLGLLEGDTREMLAEGVGGLFMPHGLGHMIGLDVHDMEDLGEQHIGYRAGLKRSTQLGLRSLRLARELETGFVLTVEPGIYFIPELIEKWRTEGKFKNFIRYDKLQAWQKFGGIRIEDNILITENGHQILGEHIPKTVSEVENERAKAF